MGRPRVPGLTNRQLQVLCLIAEGLEYRVIARRLFLSENTVKTHALALFERLGVRTRAHAVSVAFQRGFLLPDPCPCARCREAT